MPTLQACVYFNPRSLTGATPRIIADVKKEIISIHAPSRERPKPAPKPRSEFYFNPRSLTGATALAWRFPFSTAISIHAPSRERQADRDGFNDAFVISIHAPSRERLAILRGRPARRHFNPRSLTGATSLAPLEHT